VSKKMTAFGFASLIASTLIYAFAENILVFYLGGMLLGVGLAFTTTTMASSIIRRWFKKNIGKYTGIVFAANGIGGAVAAQIVSPLINEEGNPFGYRKAYIVVAIILLVVGIIVVALIQAKPSNEEKEVVAETQKKVSCNCCSSDRFYSSGNQWSICRAYEGCWAKCRIYCNGCKCLFFDAKEKRKIA